MSFALHVDLPWSEELRVHGSPERDEFLRAYAPLVRYLAERSWARVAGDVDLDDMVGDGMIGLIEALDHQVPKVRANAAWCLGQAGNRKAIPYLQRRAQDKNPTVRLEISRQLLFLGDYSQVGELITGLDSDNARVRFLSYEALRSTTGKDYGYDSRVASKDGRAEAVGKWQQWWEEQKKSQWFENSSRMAAPGK